MCTEINNKNDIKTVQNFSFFHFASPYSLSSSQLSHNSYLYMDLNNLLIIGFKLDWNEISS